MKTKCTSIYVMDKNNSRKVFATLQNLLAATLFLSLVVCCSNDEPDPVTQPEQPGAIQGTVKDENGNPYPNTLVSLSKGSEKNSVLSNQEGVFTLATKNIGSYDVEMALPLSTEPVSANPTKTNVLADQATPVDFVLSPKPVEAHLNFGNVQLLEEIVDKDGNTPLSPNEPLFAKNNFDAPLGLLTEIKAPDGHQITLSEFKTAKGQMLVHCNGNSSTIEIMLEGMIPNGTYTFWLAYMKRKVKVGESIDFSNDFVNFTNPPIGPANGSGNMLMADATGTIEATLDHASCILTDEVGLVIPVLYHINGKTFGGGHVPDTEEMVQMLVYFQ